MTAPSADAAAHWYRHYGLNMRSEIALPNLPAGDPAAPIDVAIRYGAIPPERPAGKGDYQNWYAGPDGLVFHGFGIGRMRISGGSAITLDPGPGVGDPAIVSILLGTGMSALLLQRRILPMHACSIATADGAILFMGRSGAGKSTLLAGLIAAGWTMLADDVTGVRIDDAGRPIAIPAFPALRLWTDSIAQLDLHDRVHMRVRDDIEKFYVRAPRFHADPMPVRAVVLLGSNNAAAPSVRPIAMSDRVEALGRYVHRKKFVRAFGIHAWAFDALVTFASAVDMRAISRPALGATPEQMTRFVMDQFDPGGTFQPAAA